MGMAIDSPGPAIDVMVVAYAGPFPHGVGSTQAKKRGERMGGVGGFAGETPRSARSPPRGAMCYGQVAVGAVSYGARLSSRTHFGARSRETE
jgi:hypothetical protein